MRVPAALGGLLAALLLVALGPAGVVDVRAASLSTANPALPHGPRMLQQMAGAQAPQAAANWLQGVDVASFQHLNGAPIDWSQIAAAGYGSPFIKSTEGTYYTNGYFADDYAAAAAAGLFRSAYTFAAPNSSDGASQADYLLNYAPFHRPGRRLCRPGRRRAPRLDPCRDRGRDTPDGKSMPPAVDLEWDPYDSTLPAGGSARRTWWAGSAPS